MSTAATPKVTGFADLWSRTPAAIKGGAVLAVLGFLIHFTSVTITVVNGVRTCTASDLGSAALGALAVVAALTAFRRSGTAPSRRLPVGWLWPLALIVMAVGVWHITRGVIFTDHLCRP